MKKLLSLLLIICSIGVAYADDKSTVTSLKYVTDELNTRQDKFGANDGKAMTFTNAAGGNLPRDVKASLGTSTSDNGLPTVSAVNTGIATKQDEIGAVNTNTVVTYTGTPGTLGQKGIYQDTGTYAAQQNNLIQASTFNAALRNGLNNEFVCADRDPVSNQCWLWTIDNATNETITVRGKNLLDPSKYDRFTNTQLRWNYADGYLLKAGTTYTFSTNSDSYLYFVRKSDNASLKNAQGQVSYTPTDDVLVYFRAYKSPELADGYNFQLELGSAATPYEPYVDETVNVYIPQNQTAQNQ